MPWPEPPRADDVTGDEMEIFIAEADDHWNEVVREALRRGLPETLRGYPVGAVRPIGEGGFEPKVAVGTLRRFVELQLAYDTEQPPDVADWLTFPSQRLSELTAGAVYHDGVGELTALRERLAWYPRDVWLYLLACQWRRIDQEEPFVGRTGEVGDDLGSAVIAARPGRDIMRLCFRNEAGVWP